MLKVKVIPHKLGNLKLAFVKCVKTHTNLGLKEAKEMAEKLPSVLKETAPKAEAEEIVNKMKVAGSKAVMKGL